MFAQQCVKVQNRIYGASCSVVDASISLSVALYEISDGFAEISWLHMSCCHFTARTE